MNAARMASKGRNGDTTVGHLTPGEIVIPREVIDNQPQLMSAIIKAFNKYGENMQQSVDWRRYVVGDEEGPTNPETGAEEFYGPDAARSHGGGVAGQAAGGSSSSGPGGGVSRGLPTDRQQNISNTAERTQVQRGGYGRTGAAAAYSAGVTPAMTALDRTILGTLGTVAGSTMWGGGYTDMGRKALGLVGVDIGPGVRGDLNTRDGAPQHGGRDGGALFGTRDPNRPAIPPRTPVAQTNRYLRPAPMTPAFALNMGGMDDFQQRAAIATRALMGDDSVYRSDEARDYYKNLLQRSLINPDGSLNGIGQLLPIETQYIQNILGLTYQPTTKSLLDAIASA